MKIFLLKDVERVGIAGEIILLKNGFARNFILPKKLGIEVTAANEPFYKSKAKSVDERRAVIATKTSILAEKISSLTLKIKHKAHDDGKLYGAITAAEIMVLLAKAEVSVAKNQIIVEKSIKETGIFEVTVKLSNKLQPKVKLKVSAE
jgi:large subunit ribosomal protein L9